MDGIRHSFRYEHKRDGRREREKEGRRKREGERSSRRGRESTHDFFLAVKEKSNSPQKSTPSLLHSVSIIVQFGLLYSSLLLFGT